MEQGAEKLIFDVRNNPGGLLTELLDLLDFLLPEGDTFISVDYTGGETVYHSDESCVDLPVSILVNEETYSAAEFLRRFFRRRGAAGWWASKRTEKDILRCRSGFQTGLPLYCQRQSILRPAG